MNSDSYYELQTNILFQADDFAEAYRRCIEGKKSKKLMKMVEKV